MTQMLRMDTDKKWNTDDTSCPDFSGDRTACPDFSGDGH